jgi:capsular exopolysaccharide synthesis family protein
MKGPNREDPVTIVDSLLQSYTVEVLDKERRTQQDTLTQLNIAYNAKRQELEDKQSRFRELSKESIGVTTDSEAARLQQNMMLMDLREMAQMREDVRRRLAEASRQMEMIKASVKAGQTRPDQFLLFDMLESDPEYFFQKQKVDELEKEMRFYSSILAPNSSQMARLQQQLGAQKQELERLRKEKTPRVVARIKRTQGLDEYSVSAVVAPLKATIGHLQAEYRMIDEKYNEMREEFRKLTEVSNEILTLHNDILNLKAFLFQLSDEREKVRVNLNQPERVQVIQKAFVPKLTGDWLMRLVYMAVAWSAVFGLTVSGITFWDYQTKRVNTTKDVDGITSGIRVVGSLPMLNQGGALWPFAKMDQRSMEVVLNFSVDSIRASLLFNQSKDKVKVVMVTSAMGQEGRTTLASQLAVSLARSGRRTVIVDADIRNPQQHYVFGTAGQRGFCDALRGDPLDRCVEPTAVENLFLVPAGAYDQRSTQAFAGDAAKRVFDGLRQGYDFVIVDVGPVLTSADALLLGQQVDTAMISVRRDVSQIPKVYDACDRLRSVGVHIIGAVVHGAGTEIRRDELKMASAQAALPDARAEPEYSGAEA